MSRYHKAVRAGCTASTLRSALLVACLGAAGAAQAAVLAGWAVEKIAGPAQGHYNISGQTAINDAGEIAFRAEGLLGPNPASSQAGIFVWSGGSFRTIGTRIERGGIYSSLDLVGGISADGVVAFRAQLPGPPSRQGIFGGNGVTTHSVTTGGCGPLCEFESVRLDPAISANRQVAFIGQESNHAGLYVQPVSGGPRSLLAFADGALPGSPLSSFIEGMSINNSGQVAFRAGLDTGINDTGVFVVSGPGTVAPIAIRGGIAPNGLAFGGNFSKPTINAAGDVVFCATLAGAESGIFVYRGGSLHTIADSVGSFDGLSFSRFDCTDQSIPSMNDAGMVAFFAEGPALGNGDDAIFMWDGAMHRLIGIGDDVGGAKLTQIRYFGGGLNNFGDIAFAGDVTGGDPLFLVRAPRVQDVPEPGSLALMTLALLASCVVAAGRALKGGSMVNLSPRHVTPAAARRPIRAAFAAIALTLGLATAGEALAYKLVIVEPPIAGAASGANDINAASTVVGWYRDNSRQTRGFRWTPSNPYATTGSAVSLAPLAGCEPCMSEADRVNQAGNTVGKSTDAKGKNRAVLWAAGSTTAVDLGLLPGYTGSYAHDINDFGEVVGRMEGPTVPAVAFRWTPTVPNGTSGILSALPHPDGAENSSAYGINNAGTVVGSAHVLAFGKTHAVRWSAAGISDLHFDHAADITTAKAINNIGQVFGNASTATAIRAWGFPGAPGGLWTDMGGVPGLPKSEVLDVNGPGRVVGKTWTNTDRAFVWTMSGGMQDLNSLIAPSNYELRQARGINDSGRIVGEAYGGPAPAVTRAFLLRPVLFARPVTDAVAVNKRPYFEICDPLHACQMVHVMNTSTRTLEGPLHVALTRLSSGRQLTNANGTYHDAPFVTVRVDGLAPGAAFEVQLVFDRSPNGGGQVQYDVDVYAGPF